jgi:FMN reductase
MTEATIVIISAGLSEPSSTRMLADRLAQKTIDQLAVQGISATAAAIELRSLGTEIVQAAVTGVPGAKLREAIDRLAAADAVIAATPVYKAGVSGLFKMFIDIIEDDLLIAKPVALTATAGSARHALVPDDQMRPLFSFLRALVIPTSLFAAPEDWADPSLGSRIDRAATELTALVSSGVTGSIVRDGWHGYQHQLGSAARRRDVEPMLAGVDFDSDLMRLAAGGTPRPARPEDS